MDLDDVGADGSMVTAGRVRVFVRRMGGRGLPPLVVIHGGPTWDHSYLMPAVGGLADVADVVLFDLPGCGRSQRVRPWGDLPEGELQPDRMAEVSAALIGGLGGVADVLGFSYGGRIAMRVVEQHPEVVRRLVLASTTAFADMAATGAVVERRRGLCVPVDFEDPALSADGAVSREMAYGEVPVQIWRLDRRAEWRQVLERVRFTGDHNRLRASGELRPAAPDDPVSVLCGWGGPLLVLHGVHDVVFPVGAARRLQAAVPGSVLAEVPEAGHMAHFDDPRSWGAAIRDFLGSAPR